MRDLFRDKTASLVGLRGIIRLQGQLADSMIDVHAMRQCALFQIEPGTGDGNIGLVLICRFEYVIKIDDLGCGDRVIRGFGNSTAGGNLFLHLA